MEADFRQRCDAVQGIVQFNEDGVLMQCVAPESSLDAPLIVLFDEFTPRQTSLYSMAVEALGDTEQARLATYFAIVYEATPLSTWASIPLAQLQALWRELELVYILPPSIMPATPIAINRPTNEALFYRIPPDVVLNQRYDYTLEQAAPNDAQVEVVHFGSINVSEPYKPIVSFTGTYFYRATGSGASVSMGSRTLVAWNKVHALNILGVPSSVIYDEAGDRFKDTVSLFMSQDGLTRQEALDRIVELMSSGKSLRTDPNAASGFTYFGLGEAGDSYLALQAITQGYTSIQLVREAQFLPRGATTLNPVGYEIILLSIPVQASEQLQVTLAHPIF